LKLFFDEFSGNFHSECFQGFPGISTRENPSNTQRDFIDFSQQKKPYKSNLYEHFIIFSNKNPSPSIQSNRNQKKKTIQNSCFTSALLVFFSTFNNRIKIMKNFVNEENCDKKRNKIYDRMKIQKEFLD
jgi:hypothetical protein